MAGSIDPADMRQEHARSANRGVSIMAKKRAAPVWRKSPDDLIVLFHAALPDDPRIERRKMFGYPCAFVGGNLFTGLHQENVIVRLAETDRVAAIRKQGARLFEPMTGRPMREYIVLPKSPLLTGERSRSGCSEGSATLRHSSKVGTHSETHAGRCITTETDVTSAEASAGLTGRCECAERRNAM
jgi:hypothetical protein